MTNAERAQKAHIFWTWFAQHQHQYLFVNQVDEAERERMFNQMTEALHAYHDRLFFEIGGHAKSETLDLIITAQGIRTLFGEVEALVQAAPKLENWNVIALKPPMGPGFKVKYKEIVFDPEKTIFIPLDNPDVPRGVGLWVCYPELNDENKNDYIFGTFLMLDSVLGERSTALDIDHLEVIRTPDDVVDYPFMHLSEIGLYVKAKKFDE